MLAAALVAVLTFAWASVDHCGEWRASPGGLIAMGRAVGPLQAGAAKVPFELPYPVTLGGYGPWLREVDSAVEPLFARATVLQVGGQKFALVSLETLLVSDSVVAAIREGRDFQVWVTATHSHTGPGNFDARLVAEVAALGRHRADVESAIVSAAKKALDAAMGAQGPAVMTVSHDSHDLTHSRSDGEIDTDLDRVRFQTVAGLPIAQWLLFAGHPTMVSRATTQLDGDYPSRVSKRFEAEGGVALVLQTAGGNATPNGPLEEFSAVLGDRFARLLEGSPESEVALGVATSDVVLNHPDGQRIAPSFLKPAVENALCASALRHTEVSVLRLGSISFVAVPAEVTRPSAKVILQQSSATVLLSLANGYQGYLETDEAVRANTGEAHSQYFGPELLTHIAEAARNAGQAAGTFGAKAP